MHESTVEAARHGNRAATPVLTNIQAVLGSASVLRKFPLGEATALVEALSPAGSAATCSLTSGATNQSLNFLTA
jgi:hypothetical protein